MSTRDLSSGSTTEGLPVAPSLGPNPRRGAREAARAFLASDAAPPHQGYPLVDEEGGVVGVLTHRDLRTEQPGETPLLSLVRRKPVVISEECSLRDAADCMARERLGRLPVMSSQTPHRLVGIVTRTDLIHAHVGRLAAQHLEPRSHE